ncbi:hypothetical protein Tco_0333218 [Tanacetum coccineum]
MIESAKRHEENSNMIKKIRASTDAAVRNQGASIKTLEIQIGQISKVLQERGFGSVPSSTEANPRDHVKSISTTAEADSNPIRQKKGSYRPQFSKAYSYRASHIDNSIPRKEKDPGSFTLPCYINDFCFDNVVADLGASVSVMPLSTYLNLGLGELAHTKLIVELADRIVKYPKRIAENVLVGIGKFVFPVDFIILYMPEDVKVPLILRRPFLSTAHAKIDVFKRKITLRVGDEKIIFKTRLMGETLVLNRSLDPLYGDYIKLNDLNVPLELRRDQVDDLMPTIEEGDVTDEPIIDIIKTRNNEIFDKEFYNSIMKDKWKIWMVSEIKTWEISFLENHSEKLHVWKQEAEWNLASVPKAQKFLQGGLELRTQYVQDAKMEEWLTHGHISVHEME